MNINMFYRFSHNSSHNRRFTWAASILPKSDMHEVQCPKCDTRVRYPEGAFDVVVEGGNLFPDVLGCGAFPFLIVSQNVLDDWTNANVDSFHVYPVNVAEVKTKSKSLSETIPPQYYRVEIDGECHIDLLASGLTIVKHCPECGYLKTEPSVSTGFQMVAGSWDGTPLFRDRNLYPRVNFCSNLILRLAEVNHRTNFRFELMSGPYDQSSKGINYLRPSK